MSSLTGSADIPSMDKKLVGWDRQLPTIQRWLLLHKNIFCELNFYFRQSWRNTWEWSYCIQEKKWFQPKRKCRICEYYNIIFKFQCSVRGTKHALLWSESWWRWYLQQNGILLFWRLGKVWNWLISSVQCLIFQAREIKDRLGLDG